MRTIFFRWHRLRNRPPSLACACREHRRKVQRRRILLGAHGAPYRRCSRVAGFAAYQHADFARMGGAVAVRLVPQRFENGRSGPRCCRLATVSGGQVVAGTAGCGRWYLRANPLPMVRRRFSPASLPRRLKAFSLETGGAGRGGRPPPSRRFRPDPVASSRQPIIPWKNRGPPFTMTPFPPCFVSAPPLCRKGSLST